MQKEETEKSTYEIFLGCTIAIGAIISSYVIMAMWWSHIIYAFFNLNCDKLLLGVGFYLASCVLDRNYAWFWIAALIAQCFIWLTLV